MSTPNITWVAPGVTQFDSDLPPSDLASRIAGEYYDYFSLENASSEKGAAWAVKLPSGYNALIGFIDSVPALLIKDTGYLDGLRMLIMLPEFAPVPAC